MGLCCATMDSYSYKVIKEEVQNILNKSGWDPEIEFKGATLFSITQGDRKISVEKRIEIARKLLELNIAKKHSRIKFDYCDFLTTDFKKDYLSYFPIFLKKILSKAPKGGGKDLLILHLDEHQSIKMSELRKVVKKTINDKGYVLFEDVNSSCSNFETVGILYADLVGYLTGRLKIISKDIDLFKLSPEQLKTDGRYKKLLSSKDLIQLIKKLDVYKVNK